MHFVHDLIAAGDRPRKAAFTTAEKEGTLRLREHPIESVWNRYRRALWPYLESSEQSPVLSLELPPPGASWNDYRISAVAGETRSTGAVQVEGIILPSLPHGESLREDGEGSESVRTRPFVNQAPRRSSAGGSADATASRPAEEAPRPPRRSQTSAPRSVGRPPAASPRKPAPHPVVEDLHDVIWDDEIDVHTADEDENVHNGANADDDDEMDVDPIIVEPQFWHPDKDTRVSLFNDLLQRMVDEFWVHRDIALHAWIACSGQEARMRQYLYDPSSVRTFSINEDLLIAKDKGRTVSLPGLTLEDIQERRAFLITADFITNDI